MQQSDEILPTAPEPATEERPRRRKSTLVVRALTSFGDIRGGHSYKAGDIVVGWDRARAEHYAARGLVEIEYV